MKWALEYWSPSRTFTVQWFATIYLVWTWIFTIYYNTLHIAPHNIHHNALQHIARHYTTLQHITTHYTTLHNITTHYNRFISLLQWETIDTYFYTVLCDELLAWCSNSTANYMSCCGHSEPRSVKTWSETLVVQVSESHHHHFGFVWIQCNSLLTLS